jgi:isopentenyl diphosphate isomerase/L-lactate dehydrogenase-like FMN-dependent dehydrogenase
MMYAVAALGAAGPKAAIDLLSDEISRCLAQIGITSIAALKSAAPIVRRGRT